VKSGRATGRAAGTMGGRRRQAAAVLSSIAMTSR